MLTQKTPLRTKTPLRAKTQLKTKTPLKAKKPLTAKKGLTQKKPLNSNKFYILSEGKVENNASKKNIIKSKKKPSIPYCSIFTNDMNICFITKDKNNIDPHHIFGGYNKAKSEKYHFMLPLRRDWHTLSSYSIHVDKNFAVNIKLKCQDYWIQVLNKSEEEWIDTFNKWWTESDMISEDN